VEDGSSFQPSVSEPYEDLEQIGYFGLIRAIERFSPIKDMLLVPLQFLIFESELLHFLRDHSSLLKIPRRWQDLYAQGKRFKRMALSLGRCPKDSEIARKLQVSVQEWQTVI